MGSSDPGLVVHRGGPTNGWGPVKSQAAGVGCGRTEVSAQLDARVVLRSIVWAWSQGSFSLRSFEMGGF